MFKYRDAFKDQEKIKMCCELIHNNSTDYDLTEHQIITSDKGRMDPEVDAALKRLGWILTYDKISLITVIKTQKTRQFFDFRVVIHFGVVACIISMMFHSWKLLYILL